MSIKRNKKIDYIDHRTREKVYNDHKAKMPPYTDNRIRMNNDTPQNIIDTIQSTSTKQIIFLFAGFILILAAFLAPVTTINSLLSALGINLEVNALVNFIILFSSGIWCWVKTKRLGNKETELILDNSHVYKTGCSKEIENQYKYREYFKKYATDIELKDRIELIKIKKDELSFLEDELNRRQNNEN